MPALRRPPLAALRGTGLTTPNEKLVLPLPAAKLVLPAAKLVLPAVKLVQ